jgi:uncharacterized membrane protein
MGMSLLVMAVCGLAIDGTKAFLYRRTLQSAADAAALAGAGEVDATRYYASQGRSIDVDPRLAGRAAERLLSLRGIQARASVSASEERVVVVLRGEVPTLFLRLIGLEKIPVAAEAASAPAAVP